MNFIEAIIDNDLPKVKELIAAGTDVNFQNGYKMTALMTAARRGYLEIVKELVEAGADVNLKDDYGMTALILSRWSKCLSRCFETERYLKQHGATE